MRVEIHIDRLVLDGVPVERTSVMALRSAVESELGAMLSQGLLPPAIGSGGAIDLVRAPRIDVGPTHTPMQIGRAIANSLHGGLGQ